ncbi:hypothetical protein [Sphingobacterium sp. DR205]|uniref:hypothetical protein n=1 Tax=Sphingobacterium sp. DR205 TaxID=2713573 RepID=UPI0013E4C9EE|nr:hypothetical protein [Sphingobacterium sp. DR205]QIH34103.1 hypothetical protein G6053_14945 [Sphingobacterium sp. DR205]
MVSYFKYIAKQIVRSIHIAVLVLRYSGAGNSQWGQDFTKLYLCVMEKRVRKESALTRYRRKFALFPRWWVQKILVWQIRSPRQYHQAFYAKAGAIKLQSEM